MGLSGGKLRMWARWTIASCGFPVLEGRRPWTRAGETARRPSSPILLGPVACPIAPPPPSAGTVAFSVSLTISAIHDVGNTQFGRRRHRDISGGTITGDRLNGTVLTGGLDYELTLSTGAMELEEILILKTSDNIQSSSPRYSRRRGPVRCVFTHCPRHRGPYGELIRLAEHRHARSDARGRCCWQHDLSRASFRSPMGAQEVPGYNS